MPECASLRSADRRTMHRSLSAQVRAHIDRLAQGTTGVASEDAARRFDALPLYEGWQGWGLLTEQGQVLEAIGAGIVSPAPRWSGSVKDRVPGANGGAPAAQLNRQPRC
jgi:hypothetical protein